MSLIVINPFSPDPPLPEGLREASAIPLAAQVPRGGFSDSEPSITENRGQIRPTATRAHRQGRVRERQVS